MSGDVQEIGNRLMKKVNKENRPVFSGRCSPAAAARRISILLPANPK
jgi:hypothetical protein